MIENRNTLDKGLESALKALEQAKQRVANEKKKQNEKKRKAENHHKYMMGGIVAKYFPKCYSPTGVPPYPLVNFAYRHTPKCGVCLSTKSKKCRPKGG